MSSIFMDICRHTVKHYRAGNMPHIFLFLKDLCHYSGTLRAIRPHHIALCSHRTFVNSACPKIWV